MMLRKLVVKHWKVYVLVVYTVLLYNIARMAKKHLYNNPRMQSLILERYNSNETSLDKFQGQPIWKIIRKVLLSKQGLWLQKENFHNFEALNGLKIYAYNLSSKFNWDIANQFTEQRKRFDMSEFGYGTVLNFADGMTARNTRQNFLDVIFYGRLMKSSFVTHDPEDADLFYIPYFHDMIRETQINNEQVLVP